MSMNRGIPGITDNQRSGDFKNCIEKEAGWTTEYEHYGQYTDEGGFQGTSLILQSYPESIVIHNANTAMAMGSVEAQLSMGKEKDIFSTGWGGTGKELAAIRRGELDATPMRMGDDVGAATAEAIKYHLEGKRSLPLLWRWAAGSVNYQAGGGALPPPSRKGKPGMYGVIEGTGFEVIEPEFEDCFVGHARVERLWSGARWSEGPVWFAAGR